MKINPFDRIPPSTPPDRSSKNRKAENSGSVQGAASGEDVVQVSNRSSDIQKYAALTNDLPDVRMDRVDDLSRQISDGQYNVDAEQVADALLKGTMIDTEM